jgi:hypothetical protein
MTDVYCCDVFKKECENYNEFYQDGIGKSKYDDEYYFFFEGCMASCPLIYCPNCGARIANG